MIKKLKEKKGFTLVELIVVLVILAILAALLVPALTGYIDKAKRKSIVADTRQAVMAAQTLTDEAYAKKNVGGAVTIGTASTDDVKLSEVENLAELPSGSVKSATIENAKIKTLTYEKSGKTCVYTLGAKNGTDGAYDVK